MPWWRHQMETFSALLAICAGNSPVSGEFPTQRPVTRSFGVFFDLHPNKRLSRQWWGWWFETLSCPLLRHGNAKCVVIVALMCMHVNWFWCYFHLCHPNWVCIKIILSFKGWEKLFNGTLFRREVSISSGHTLCVITHSSPYWSLFVTVSW